MDHTQSEILRSLFPFNNEDLEERQFSRLHKIILGLDSYGLVQELAISNVAVDAIDSEGYTPLMWAARRGDHDAVHLLLKAGSCPNVCDHKIASTPLMVAAATSSSICVRSLLQAGANIAFKSADKRNALHYAVQFNGNEEILHCLIAAGVELEGRDTSGSTPLQRAITCNQVVLAKALLDYGANINTFDNENDTPLSESLFYHHDDSTQLLLHYGASYTSPNSLGGSILHLAAKSGGLRTLEILLAASLKGIDTEAIDNEGKTALQIAQERERKEEGFVEKFQALLLDIQARNAAQIHENNEDINRAAPNQPPVEHQGATRLLRPLWTISAPFQPFFNRIQNLLLPLHDQTRLAFAQLTWISLLVYWILGLGWVGFIYVSFGVGAKQKAEGE